MKKVFLLVLNALACQFCFAQWSTNGSTVYYNSGHVGIGTSSPSTNWSKVLQVYDYNNAALSVKTPVADWQIITAANGGLDFRDITGGGNAGRFFISSNGNVGIGTTNPTQKLHVLNPSSSTYLNLDKTNGTEAGVVFSKNNAPLFYLWSDNADDDALKIEVAALPGEVDATPRMMFPSTNKNIYMAQSGGSVGIGTTNVNDANYRLFVETGLRTRKIKVDQLTWPDYVFDNTYKLPSLKQVEEFIKQHQHLPDIPSEAEVKKEGLNLGDTQALLLKKIEELTLYIIEQQKQLEKLTQIIELKK